MPDALSTTEAPADPSLTGPSTAGELRSPARAESAEVSRRVRRWTILALALGGFGIGTTEFVAMGLLPNIAGSLGVSEPTAGHVISAYAMGVVVGAPLIAALTARMSRRTLLIGLMVAFTVGNLATVLAPDYGLLLVARFVAGLPHGAYFGVAALVAAHLAGPRNRGKAVGQVMLGLSVANVLGVPAAAWLGETLGWRSAFAIVVVIGIATVVALIRVLPTLSGVKTTDPLTELGALKRSQVWFTLVIGTVGFGGMFAFYTYLNSALTTDTGLSVSVVPFALMLYGLGMVTGNFVGGYVADRSVAVAILGGLTATALSLGAFAVLAENAWAALILTYLVALTGSMMLPALQTRLMDVAADAQTLAAALNHSALNIANAAGALLGGVVVGAGYGYLAPSVVGVMLAVAGIAVTVVALATARRQARHQPVGS